MTSSNAELDSTGITSLHVWHLVGRTVNTMNAVNVTIMADFFFVCSHVNIRLEEAMCVRELHLYII